MAGIGLSYYSSLLSKPIPQMIGVFGPALKEIIQDEFGDGIMSAIDFNFNVAREPNPAGDRVKITLSGKFLPYKSF